MKIKKLLFCGMFTSISMPTLFMISCGPRVDDNNFAWKPEERIAYFNLNVDSNKGGLKQFWTKSEEEKDDTKNQNNLRDGIIAVARSFEKVILKNNAKKIIEGQKVTVHMGVQFKTEGIVDKSFAKGTKDNKYKFLIKFSFIYKILSKNSGFKLKPYSLKTNFAEELVKFLNNNNSKNGIFPNFSSTLPSIGTEFQVTNVPKMKGSEFAYKTWKKSINSIIVSN